MRAPGRRKHIAIAASLRYGWRLTMRHLNTLVPGTVVFYLPELFARWGLSFNGEEVAATVFRFVVGCWLLWHALQLSDRETRSSRFHEPVLPASGYVGRFLGSTLLFWGVLGLTLWPAWRVATGTWMPSPGGLEWLKRPGGWTGSQVLQALETALVALPAGLWAVFGWFHGYYVADEGQGPWQSMESSFLAVRGAFLSCVIFLVVIGLVNALGLALMVVGVFLAFPVTLMATTYIHLELKRQTAELRAMVRTAERRSPAGKR